MIDRLKWLLMPNEMRALQRYRVACYLARQWNSAITASAETADWIEQVGSGARGMDIEQFRERLKATQQEGRSDER